MVMKSNSVNRSAYMNTTITRVDVVSGDNPINTTEVTTGRDWLFSYGRDFTVIEAVSGGTNRKGPNPHRYAYTEVKACTGSMTYLYTYSDANSFVSVTKVESGTSLHQAPMGTPPSVTLARNKALGKVTDSIRGGLDLSVDLAEGGQTVKMVRQIGQLESYVGGFDRKTIANRWLEFTFGWKPLVDSLFGTINELATASLAPVRISQRASNTTTTKVKSAGDGIDFTDTTSASSRVEFKFWFTPPSARVNQVARLSSLNPASIAWELMPYSFLVDYFINIGGALRDLETAVIYKSGFAGGYQTSTYKVLVTRSVSGNGKPDSNGFKQSGALTGTTITCGKVRDVLASYPFPGRPTVNVQLGASRLLNVAALLTQLLPSPVRKRIAKKRITSVKWRSLKNRLEKGDRRHKIDWSR